MKRKKGKCKELSEYIPYTVVGIALLLSLIFRSNMGECFFVFLLIPVFIYFDFDGRVFIEYAIAMLVLSAIVLCANKPKAANFLAIQSYWLLVGGVIFMILEYLRGAKNGNS